MIVAIATAAAGAATVAGVMVAKARTREAAALADAREVHAREMARAESVRAGALDEVHGRAQALRDRLARQLAEEAEAIAADEARLERLTAAVDRRQGHLDERGAALRERHEALESRRASLGALQAEIEGLDARLEHSIEEVAGQSRDDLIAELVEEMTGQTRIATSKAARAKEEGVTAHAEIEARRLIDMACQRYGAALPAARLISSVELPADAKKRDRILADGRAVLHEITEASTVEFIEQEGGFFLQAPDPFTREIARLAYERFLKGKGSGPVGPVVEKARADLEQIARDAGKRATRILKLRDVHPEIQFLVGKLLYRTSYTQNQWQHAIETAHLCGIMAEDLGLDLRTAHRAALLHDIGKVLWAETEATGSHAVSGAAFARAHGEAPEIVHPIAAHHNDEKPSSPLAHLVAAADALSGARPGARRETLEAYTRRVDDVERICTEMRPRGIHRSYVISGGREVRVHVDPRRVDDLAAARLSMDLAARIEDECVYPGQIKVTVIRETQAQAVARR